MRSLFVVALLLAGTAAMLAAQDPPPLVTDRPDQTESAAIVPIGLFQVESGAVFSRTGLTGLTGEPDLDVLDLGATLVRIGVHSRVEARLGFAGYQRVEQEGTPSESGVGDLNVGAKVQLAPGRGRVPQVAVIGTVILPTAEEGFGADEVSGEARLALAHELTDRLSLGWNVGAAFERATAGDVTRTETEVLYTVALGIAATERIGLFAESFGAFGMSSGRPDRHLVDGGVTLAVLPNVQLDASGGIGLSDATEDWFVGGGVSVRVPR